uniref:Uncharacterized protein n=1 Tax=Setaria digitata TaxID=48799 RepID=A0A915Q4A1_9BILA
MACWTVSLNGGPKRVNQAAAAIGSTIYSFGGCCCDNNYINSELDETFGVHVLNTSTYRWKRLRTRRLRPSQNRDISPGRDPSSLPYGETPTKRVGHTAVAYEGKIYLWGGYCTATSIRRTWSVIPSDGDTPPGRTRHTAVVFNDMMIIYGGRDDHAPTLPNDVWAYNFKTRKWYGMALYGQIPRGRECHTACVIDGKMYVFGGVDESDDELYLDVLNLREGYWETPEIFGDQPSGRRDPCSWVYQEKMYLFGGCQQSDEEYLATLHEFDPRTSMWQECKPIGLVGPEGRQRHCGVIVGSRAFIFSGLASIITLDSNFGFGCLIEICDLHVLNYDWKLKELSAHAIMRYGLIKDAFNVIPADLSYYLRMMTLPNYTM